MDDFLFTVLGCGTTAINRNKGCPGYVLEAGGKTILLESGSGTLYRLAKTGVSVDSIDTVCYSHHHPDHISDLLPLLHSLKWDPSLKKKTRELTIMAPQKVLDFYRQLLSFYGDSISPDNKRLRVNLRSTSNGPIILGNIAIECRRVAHTQDSVGFRFSFRGKTLAYSGDAGLDASLVKLAANCDLLLCECSFPNDRKFEGHMCPRDIDTLIKKANPKKVLITHIYPHWSRQEKKELGDLTKKYRAGLAKDFMAVKL
ncbi:MAG: MBL fold metallo-hydrolase [Actinomycetota bacterium]